MAMNKQVLGVSVLIFTFLLTPALVLAQSSSQVVDFIWVKTFKFERQWLNNPNQLILQALLPAVAIYAIFLGLLRTMRIFEGMGSMEHVIALIVMFVMLFTGGLSWISGGLLILGSWSFIVFFALFFIGSILYAWGFWKRGSALASIYTSYKHESRNIERKVKAMNETIKIYEKNLGEVKKNGGSDEERFKWLHKIEDAQYKVANMENELNKMRRAVKDVESVA